MAEVKNRMIEGARVMFRNFAGLEKPFNAAGDRNFVVFLEPDLAEEMKAEGWNVKSLRPREEDEGDPQQFVTVSVSFRNRPPRIVLVTNGGKKRTDIGEGEIDMLDFAEVANWDLVLNPYSWDVNGNTGVKAYLKTAFVTLEEDELELKYAGDEDEQDPRSSLSTVNEEALV